ncbi:MAG: hypothetical protein JNM09_02460 [Blastocatellia bacterium]|nr:hypothetical protein [Blastocatellia bacterium]
MKRVRPRLAGRRSAAIPFPATGDTRHGWPALEAGAPHDAHALETRYKWIESLFAESLFNVIVVAGAFFSTCVGTTLAQKIVLDIFWSCTEITLAPLSKKSFCS